MANYRNTLWSVSLLATLLASATVFSRAANAEWTLTSVVVDASLSTELEDEGGHADPEADAGTTSASSFWPTTGHNSPVAKGELVLYSNSTFSWQGGGTPTSSFTVGGYGSLNGTVTGDPLTTGQLLYGHSDAASSVNGITEATSGGVSESRSAPYLVGNHYTLSYTVPMDGDWTFTPDANATSKVVSIKIACSSHAYQTASMTSYTASAYSGYSFQ